MFPLSSHIPLGSDLSIHYQSVIDIVGPLLTKERLEKIDKIVPYRNFETAVVLDGIYDRGNISAVMRTAEGLGFTNFHVIETQEKFKKANRVTKGADKWVEVQKWQTPTEAINKLKKDGYKIVVTTLEGSKPIEEVDFSGKTALVLGNEKEGVSQEMLDAADERIIIPMVGFVQSFNISVAGALSLYHIKRDRIQRTGKNEDVTKEQQDILKAYYYLRTQESAEDILRETLNRRALV